VAIATSGGQIAKYKAHALPSYDAHLCILKYKLFLLAFIF